MRIFPSFAPRRVECPLDGPARWLMADLGPGNDRFAVKGSLVAVGSVRVNGGEGEPTGEEQEHGWCLRGSVSRVGPPDHDRGGRCPPDNASRQWFVRNSALFKSAQSRSPYRFFAAPGSASPPRTCFSDRSISFSVGLREKHSW